MNRLAATGLSSIEAVSFVHPERVPQMAGAEEVVAALERRAGVSYAGLVLNERGSERFSATPLDALHFNVAATESFSRRNANASVEETLATLERLGGEKPLGVSVSAAFGCPFEGAVDPERVLDIVGRAEEAGAEEVILADTIGVAVPRQVKHLVAESAKRFPRLRVGAHFHNPRNTGFANAYAALEAGTTVLESSVGGLGGCPFAPGATGNVATEDLVYLLHGEGVDTGVDLDIGVSSWLEGVLGRPLPGQVFRAGGFAVVAG